MRRGEGVRIEAKLARSYYLVVSDAPPMAMCIVGGDASPGDKNRIAQPPLELAVGEPVQFPIVYSSTRLADRPGELIEITAEQFYTSAADTHCFASAWAQTLRTSASGSRNRVE